MHGFSIVWLLEPEDEYSWFGLYKERVNVGECGDRDVNDEGDKTGDA